MMTAFTCASVPLRLFTDFRRPNRDETVVIMTEIHDKWGAVAG
jgi:hypothetical protein